VDTGKTAIFASSVVGKSTLMVGHHMPSWIYDTSIPIWDVVTERLFWNTKEVYILFQISELNL
jgi:hypothetical protein